MNSSKVLSVRFGADTHVGIDRLCTKLGVSKPCILAMAANRFLSDIGVQTAFAEDTGRPDYPAKGVPVALARRVTAEQSDYFKLICRQFGITLTTGVARGLKQLFADHGIVAPVDGLVDGRKGK